MYANNNKGFYLLENTQENLFNFVLEHFLAVLSESMVPHSMV